MSHFIKTACLFIFCFLVHSVAGAQSCPSAQIELRTQEQVDAFPQTYASNCTFPGGIRIRDKVPSAPGTIITNLDGLSVLTNIDGPLFLGTLRSILDLRGLHNLETIGSTFGISICDEITDMEGLTSLRSIDGPFTISDCQNLQNLDGMAVLETVGTIDFSRLDALQSISTLTSLTTIIDGASIRLTDLPQLESIDPLQNATADFVFQISLTSLPQVTSLSALSGINSNTSGIGITDLDALTDLSGFENHTSLNDGYLIVTDCENLSDISSTASLIATIPDFRFVTIQRNPLLSDCSITELCEALNRGVPLNISDNDIGCSSVAEIEERCPVYVPDDAFEQALIDLGYDSAPLDDYIPAQNINTVTTLNVDNEGIADLTGIKGFVLLEDLSVTGNQVSSLDLSLNSFLTSINVSTNLLVELDLRNGNNMAIPTAGFTATGNPGLSCIRVDDVVYATNNWTSIDAGTSYDTECLPSVECAPPASLSISNITHSGADIVINGNTQGFDNYDIFISSVGWPDENSSPTIENIPSGTYTWNVGASFTEYFTSIRGNCGNGNVSSWSSYPSFTTLPSCGDTWTDDGGPDGNYTNGTGYNIPVVICPDSPGDAVSIDISELELSMNGSDACYNFLRFYDGVTTAATEILYYDRGTGWCYEEAQNPAPGFGNELNLPIVAQNPTGCITVKFQASPGIPKLAGWVADITCAPLTTCLPPVPESRSNFEYETSIDVSWTDANTPGGNGFDLFFTDIGTADVAPFQDTVPTLNDVTGTSATWNGAQHSTTYSCWVRADCDGNNATASRWRLIGYSTTLTPPPSNDECSSATDITANLNTGPALVGSNALASPGSVAPPAGNCVDYLSWCEGTAHRDVWYTVTIPNDDVCFGVLIVDAIGSSFDTQVAVWDDCDGNLISADDDFYASYRSFVPTAVIPGQTYYIQVDGWNNAAGNINLDLRYFPITGPPPSDAGLVTANIEATGIDGWTHYVNTQTGHVLSSVKKQGNYLGLLGFRNNANYSVEVNAQGGVVDLGVAAEVDSECADIATPYVTIDHRWVIRRTWDVSPSLQPQTPVMVRSYYTTQDYHDVAAELPNDVSTHTDLTHYKIILGEESLTENPCHETIQPADYIEFSGGSYTYGTCGTGHYAEFPVTSFSGGGGGGGNGTGGALPIDLLIFDGETFGKENRLWWETATEENAGLFTLERSASGYDGWEALTEVPAAGSSATPHQYEAFDEAPLPTAYYRLRTTDFDESSDYGPILRIDNFESNNGLNIFPVPTTGSLQLRFSAAAAGWVPVVFMDLTGRAVGSFNLKTEIGIQTISLNIAELPRGIYLVSIPLDGEKFFRRIVKQ